MTLPRKRLTTSAQSFTPCVIKIGRLSRGAWRSGASKVVAEDQEPGLGEYDRALAAERFADLLATSRMSASRRASIVH
jgi:hypothetical protein